MERLNSALWRKSSYSGSNGGNCLEAASSTDLVMIRDTKHNGTGPVLGFTPAAWATFTAQVKNS